MKIKIILVSLMGVANAISAQNNKIETTGNVGVGTPNPSQKLELYGGGNFLIKGGNNDAGDLIFQTNTSRQLGRIWTNTSGESGMYFSSGDNSPDIAISSSGNIGIGTTSPSQKLELYGGGNFLIKGGNNDAGDLIFQTNTSRQLGRIWTSNSGESGLYFSSGDNSPDIAISSSGNIGIGTTTTGNHKLAVEGSIGAREIKVEAFPDWSDFVFEKKYNLPTLIEVETYIKEMGHLKDIPSAEEVKKEGFFLAKMDAKLLQKIEELTLYTIEQEKNLKSQILEIEKLKKENEKLETINKSLLLIQLRLENLESKKQITSKQ